MQFSLGRLLHCLSACGHGQVLSLAESVAAKWLQGLDTLADTSQVSGCGRGVARV